MSEARTTNGVQIADIEAILKEVAINFRRRDDGALEFPLTGKTTYIFVCTLRPNRRTISISVVGLLMLPLAHPRVEAVSQLMLHLNFRTWLGHFERDATDGEVRFRLEFPSWEESIEEWQFTRMIVACASAVDADLELINRVAAGDLPLEEAIATIEKQVEAGVHEPR